MGHFFSIQLIVKNMPLTGFELWTGVRRSDCSTNCDTTTDPSIWIHLIHLHFPLKVFRTKCLKWNASTIKRTDFCTVSSLLYFLKFIVRKFGTPVARPLLGSPWIRRRSFSDRIYRFQRQLRLIQMICHRHMPKFSRRQILTSKFKPLAISVEPYRPTCLSVYHQRALHKSKIM